MRRSRFSEEQIIGILKEHEAGVSVSDLCRKHGVSDASIYKWKAKFGGMDVSEAKRLRALDVDFGFNVGLETCLEDSSVSIGTGSGAQSQLKPEIRASSEGGLSFQDRLPPLDIFVGDLLLSRSDRFHGELVERAEDFCGYAVRRPCKRSQALSREHGRSLQREASDNRDRKALKLVVGLPPRQHHLIQPS
jgi:putative transposase